MNGFKGKEDTRFSCTTIKVTLNQTYAYMYMKYIKDAPPKSQYGAYSKYSRVFLIILTTDGGLHQTVKLFKIEFRKLLLDLIVHSFLQLFTRTALL